MADEFDDLIEEPPAVPEQNSSEPPQPPSPAALAEVRSAGLVTAASLLPPDFDHDQGDFGPGGTYKGFEILPESEWPQEKRHAHIKRRFYVRHNDTVGLVPWPGSMIVWPWEAAWEQDLYRETVTSYLKEEEKKGAKRGRAT